MSFAGRIDGLSGSEPFDPPPPGGEAAWLEARWRLHQESFLDAVRGDFTLALFDPERQVVVAARDGFGNRCLAWRADSSGISFAENEAELAGGAELEPMRLAEYYAYCDLSGPETLFQGVRSLLPGELLVFRDGRIDRRRLPGPDLERRARFSSWEEYVERFAELLSAAVRRALFDIAPGERSGVWLSGGLDSTPIAALATKELAARNPAGGLDAFSWSLSDPGGDESAFVIETSARIGARLHIVPCDDALPFSDLTSWPVHPATPHQTPYRWFHERSYARAAELGLRVVLNGFHGDSLYGHAHRWFWSMITADGPGRAIDRLREIARERGQWKAIRGHLIGPLLPRSRSLRRSLRPYLTANAAERLLAAPHYPPTANVARRPRQAERLLSLLDAHGDSLERWFAARHGIESRSPLRDRDLMQFMLAVPDHLLVQGEETRPVLRAAMRDRIPRSVLERRSKGHFRELLWRGLTPAALPWAGRLLFAPDALWRGYVREEAVRRWVAGDLAQDHDVIGFLQCLNGEVWRLKRAGADLEALTAR